ncbi:MAG: four helix bundle protein [Flavobacteriales bacterium]|nr:four helix bundle protein [Flavobacteriales bacterium]NQX97444.1 four helix bundle protein [Flavobacteriales bacterium]
MKLEDLKLYQECLDFEKEVWDIVNQWEGFNRDTVGKPFIQSADAISGNIAQGYGRYNFKDKKHYCYISRGYLLKTKGWLIKSKERELIGEEKADELIEFVEKIHRMLNAYIRSIGRPKDENYSKPSYNNREENKSEADGNAVATETTSGEPDGNSFTASADEFFSSDELTNA